MTDLPLQPEKAISGNAARSFRRKKNSDSDKRNIYPFETEVYDLAKKASLLKTGRRIMSDNQFAQADDTLQASIIPPERTKKKDRLSLLLD